MKKSLLLKKNSHMSKVAAYYHIVFCTKRRELVLPRAHREDLFRFIWKVVIDNKCRLLRVGGVGNHVHLLMDLNPTISLSSLISEIKTKTSRWLNNDERFPLFMGWAREYFATTVSPSDKDRIIEYIKTQPEHHGFMPLYEELKNLHSYAGFSLHENDYME